MGVLDFLNPTQWGGGDIFGKGLTWIDKAVNWVSGGGTSNVLAVITIGFAVAVIIGCIGLMLKQKAGTL